MTKSRLKKKPNQKIGKSLKILIAAILPGVSLVLALWLYNYIDMRIDKPLGKGNEFVFIKQDIVKGPLVVPTETFYYATDVAPEDFVSKFEGWSTKTNFTDAEMGTRTDIAMQKGNLYAHITYCSREQCRQDPMETSDFKGKEYIFYILGTSMYFLNPDNIHPSMKQQVEDDVKRNYIR